MGMVSTPRNRTRRAGALAMSAAMGIGLGTITATLSPGLIAWLGAIAGAGMVSETALAQPLGPAARPAEEAPPPMRTMSASSLKKMKAGEHEISVLRRAPAGEGTWPALVLLHDGWGVTIALDRAVTALADQGFVVVALDMNRGKVARDEDKAREMAILTDQETAVEQTMALIHHLKYQPEVGDHRVGIVGFGTGADVALKAAMRSDETSALALFYPGAAPDPGALRRIACPVLAVFGGQDTVVPKDRADALRAALQEAGRTAEVKVYDAAGHGFMNEDAPRHDPAASGDAWSLTAAFFRGIL